MQKIWNIKSINLSWQKSFAKELNISPILAQVLYNRGIETVDEAGYFLRADIKDTHDPYKLKGMRKAVDRIHVAIRNKEKIYIYGDYDVDGLTSSALLYFVLKQMNADVSCYIPHRIEEGYGLNLKACDYLKKCKAGLIITVDCGINSFKEIEYLNSQGVDVIVTDHHRPTQNKVPNAISVINPMQPGCTYPFKVLAGVGIAFKLAQAAAPKGLNVLEHLDLVALGTISDVAPIIGENRNLVKCGLEVLSNTKKTGLKALIDITGIANKKLATHHVGFILGPRINATGRMGSADKALQLLLSDDYKEAVELAKGLDSENKQRQSEERKTLRQALSMMETEINFKHHRSVILHNDAWHPGVIGIVASRLTEKFYRPTILISTKEAVAKGSGRSIKNFHLFDTLAKCDHLLEEFGGHEKAAGLSILKENVADFKDFFNKMVHSSLDDDDLVPVIDIDMEISLGALSEKLINELERCAPFGNGNPRPVFASRDLQLKGRPRILRGSGFKMWVTDSKVTCEAMGSKFADLDISHINDGISIVYSPSINDWQGINTIQLKLKDIQLT